MTQSQPVNLASIINEPSWLIPASEQANSIKPCGSSMIDGQADSPRLLVIDDEIEIAQSLAQLLIRKEGYRVDVVHGGHEALAYLERSIADESSIDLVLLDINITGVPGLEILSWIRRQHSLRHTRVVFLTTATSDDEKVQALSAGADDYITKPYYILELLARVKNILRSQQLEKRLILQSRQLATLNRISQAIAATLESGAVYSIAINELEHLFAVEMAAAFIVEKGKLRCRHVKHFQGSYSAADFSATSMEGDSALGMAWREQRTICQNKCDNDFSSHLAHNAPASFSVRSILATPLTVRGKSVGILAAYNKRVGGFTDVEVNLFTSLASSVSEAIENAWLFQRVRMRHEDLAAGRDTLQALIDGIPHPIYTITKDWRLGAVNKTKADELNTTPEKLAGKICYHAFYGRSQPCDHCEAAKTIIEKKEQHWPLKEGNGQPLREWEINAYPIPGKQPDSARAVLIWQDKTEERRLESSLMHASKLAAIGQLAAGVAHEINNPLTAINANAQMLKLVMPADDENYESVDIIARAGERAAKVIRGLLDFARLDQFNFSTGNINESIDEAIDLLNYLLQSATIKVTHETDTPLPSLVASWEHLNSVWLNLFLNAIEALQCTDDDRQLIIKTSLNPDGRAVNIFIHDNGKGMSPLEIEHAFEPFFTTKNPEQGTGLGLATCHRIIKQHGGEISVSSVIGEETTFVVSLPVQGPDEVISSVYLRQT